MNGRDWTERDIALLRQLYPHKPTADVAREMDRSAAAIYGAADKFGLRKSAEYLSSPAACRLRRGDNIGAAHRFQLGHVPANKGLRRPGWGPGRMKQTQFKKGQRPLNKCELGDLRENADGYIDMKIGEGKGAHAWRALHTLLWEDANGPVPAGHALYFKDRDKLNVDLENLELITRAELCRRNSIHNLPPEIKGAINVLGQLKRRIREKQNRGSAGPSVRNARGPARQGEPFGHRTRESRRRRRASDRRLREGGERLHQAHG